MNILFIYPTALTYGTRRFRSSILGKILLKYLSPPFLDFQALLQVTPKKHSFNFISEDQQKINFEEKIKETNEEIARYLFQFECYADDQIPITALIIKNEEHMKYVRDFRLRPGYDMPPV